MIRYACSIERAELNGSPLEIEQRVGWKQWKRANLDDLDVAHLAEEHLLNEGGDLQPGKVVYVRVAFWDQKRGCWGSKDVTYACRAEADIYIGIPIILSTGHYADQQGKLLEDELPRTRQPLSGI